MHLRGKLGAGVDGPDRGEGQSCAPLLRIVGGVGELELLEEVVAQIEGFADGFEPARIFFETIPSEVST